MTCGVPKTLNQWTPHTDGGQRRTGHLTFLWWDTHTPATPSPIIDHHCSTYWSAEVHQCTAVLLYVIANLPFLLKVWPFTDQSGLRQLSLFSQSGSPVFEWLEWESIISYHLNSSYPFPACSLLAVYPTFSICFKRNHKIWNVYPKLRDTKD